MKLIALLSVKDEEVYIKYCLENLISQGFNVYVINNGSKDETVNIARQFLNKGVIKIDHFDSKGVFDLERIMLHKEKLVEELEADWFMNMDADEIRLPHPPFKTFREALTKVEHLGYNVVNFNEYTFIPEKGKDYINTDYNKEMKYYYFHSPAPFIHLKLWKNIKNHPAKFATSGGHLLQFEGMRIYPNPFVLKHFIFLSEKYGKEKYSKKRNYPIESVQKYGWHGWRANFDENNFKLPDKTKLKKLVGNTYDNSEPTPTQLFYKIPITSKKETIEVKEEKERGSIVLNKKRTHIGYSLLLSGYRRIIPFRIRRKIKDLLLNTQNY